jgi:hypothetical protein
MSVNVLVSCGYAGHWGRLSRLLTDLVRLCSHQRGFAHLLHEPARNNSTHRLRHIKSPLHDLIRLSYVSLLSYVPQWLSRGAGTLKADVRHSSSLGSLYKSFRYLGQRYTTFTSHTTFSKELSRDSLLVSHLIGCHGNTKTVCACLKPCLLHLLPRFYSTTDYAHPQHTQPRSFTLLLRTRASSPT